MNSIEILQEIKRIIPRSRYWSKWSDFTDSECFDIRICDILPTSRAGTCAQDAHWTEFRQYKVKLYDHKIIDAAKISCSLWGAFFVFEKLNKNLDLKEPLIKAKEAVQEISQQEYNTRSLIEVNCKLEMTQPKMIELLDKSIHYLRAEPVRKREKRKERKRTRQHKRIIV